MLYLCLFWQSTSLWCIFVIFMETYNGLKNFITYFMLNKKFRVLSPIGLLPEMWSTECWPFCYNLSMLIHCSLVKQHGNIDLYQHWLRWWLVTWQQQAITWASADLSSVLIWGLVTITWEWQTGNFLKTISQVILQRQGFSDQLLKSDWKLLI